MPPRLREVLDFLDDSTIPGRSNIACYLLDLSGEWRESFFCWIETELKELPVRGRCLPSSSHGNVRLTIFVSKAGTVPRSHADSLDHTRVVMICADEPDRVLLELSYDSGGTLIALDWSVVNLVELPASELARLQHAGERLKEKRIIKSIQSDGKIGRNESCPCGSGKKFKRCCMK